MQRVLVTGYGGFLGTEITRQLLARGDDVVGFGRGHYPALDGLRITRIRGDVADGAAVFEAAQGVDAVIHTAAKAGVWGPWRDYYSANVLGTRNVIRACRQWSVPVLVYSSSPSVTFDGHDQSGIDETAPYPRRWLSHYPRSKAIGEQEVLAAHDPPRMMTAALRPHLIWGADDPHLFPRLIDRARRGRLRIVGDGTNRIDTVHVTNAAAAHLAAIDRLRDERLTGPGGESAGGESAGGESAGGESAGGRAYFITQDDPVGCWDWIATILEIAGVEPPRKRISFRAAWNLGHALEWTYRALHRADEPPMTRFLAAQLSRDHYFDISAARRLLGYRPLISNQQGLDELRKLWTARRGG